MLANEHLLIVLFTIGCCLAEEYKWAFLGIFIIGFSIGCGSGLDIIHSSTAAGRNRCVPFAYYVIWLLFIPSSIVLISLGTGKRVWNTVPSRMLYVRRHC